MSRNLGQLIYLTVQKTGFGEIEARQNIVAHPHFKGALRTKLRYSDCGRTTPSDKIAEPNC